MTAKSKNRDGNLEKKVFFSNVAYVGHCQKFCFYRSLPKICKHQLLYLTLRLELFPYLRVSVFPLYKLSFPLRLVVASPSFNLKISTDGLH